MPEPSRRFEVGQCAMAVLDAETLRMSSPDRCTPWASHTSSPRKPRRSRSSIGRQPKRSRQNASSSAVSATWVWSRTPSRRASSADSRISRSLAENGEHGAIAMRSMEPGDGSWNLLTARSVSASAESVS